MRKKKFQTDRIYEYFYIEWKALLLVAVFGLLYNLGLLASPWFEGKLAGCLMNILDGTLPFLGMVKLASIYVIVITAVQTARYMKRFYVRRFANNVNRRMKGILYHNLLRKSRAELEQEGMGSVMTKAISDVDDCVEGMRKFTTEVFDTGVALLGYCGMLLVYDWRLALLCFCFPPVSYVLAQKMKGIVQRTGAEYKIQAGKLSSATMDRGKNALTYRIYGCEAQSRKNYEKQLTEYERSAVKANIWTSALAPLYRVICMAGTLFILYFGSRNVLGQGWSSWDIAAFTTFLSCYTRMSVKASKASKLFNAVHKAQVSWKRMKPFMTYEEEEKVTALPEPDQLVVHKLSFSYPGCSASVFQDLSFEAVPGQIIGITGPVACGKSTLGRTFLCEYPYEGSIQWGGKELSVLPEAVRRSLTGYLGHDPELLNDSIYNNILMGEKKDVTVYLKAVCMEQEVKQMEKGIHTVIGSGGVKLSGGQAQRLALARTLCHAKPLYILDDPFSALDRDTEVSVFENVKNLTKDSIVLLISHRLDLFPQLDWILWMEEGRSVAGNHEFLMKNVPSYAQLYKIQEGGAINEM